MFAMVAFGPGKSGTKRGRIGDPWDDSYDDVAGWMVRFVVRFNGEVQQVSALDAWLRGFLSILKLSMHGL